MDRRLSRTLVWVIAAAALRQALILQAIFRSRRLLSARLPEENQNSLAGTDPVIYIIIPVLREAAIIRQTVEYFNMLIEGRNAQLVVVTTEREQAEREHHPSSGDTIQAVQELAGMGRCLYLHYPDPGGLKADQINFVARHIASSIEGCRATDSIFLLCYDADSRPPVDSLAHFQRAIAQHPNVSVFHQSSRFELRHNPSHAGRGIASWLLRPVAEAGALRANRFVLGFELPRLINRSVLVGPWKRRLGSYVYAHVTGHGLCVQLSLLLRLPFPPQSPLEDMHYSFILGSQDIDMHPVLSLDSAEVSGSLRVQVEQAARWFSGPGRFRRYLRDPQTKPGLRAWLLATSAFAICIEWLSCAIIPPLLLPLLLCAPRAVRVATASYLSVYLCGVVVTDMLLTSSSQPTQRLVRIFAYPASCMLFGLGGMMGAIQLSRGASSAGKTERGNT